MADDNSSCNLSNATIKIGNDAFFVVYNVITPIYFLAGIVCQGSLLFLLGKRLRSDSAYGYQTALSVSKLLEVVTFCAMAPCFNLFSGFNFPGPQWYISNWALMTYAAHVAIPLTNSFITSSLLLALAVAADRVFALLRPFVYRSIDQRWRFRISTVICFTVGVLLNVFDTRRFRLGYDENRRVYRVLVDDRYVNAQLDQILSRLHSVVRIASVLSLVGLNAVLLVHMRLRRRRVAQLMSESDEKEARRQARQRTLSLIAICQCCTTCLGVLPLVTYYLIAYSLPDFIECIGVIMSPFMDAALMIATLVDFFVLLTVSEQLRRFLTPGPTCGQFDTQIQQRASVRRASEPGQTTV